MSKIPLARRRSLLLAALIALAPCAHGQTADDLYRYGRREPAAGARMAALGGAAVAGLGDWTAAAANPAGLAYLDHAQVVGTLHGFIQETRRPGTFSEGEAEGVTLGVLGGAMPLPVARGALVFGGGYHATAAYARSVHGGSFGESGRSEAGWKGELSVAGAVALTPRLMGGLAVNAPIGRYHLARDDQQTGGEVVDYRLFDADLAGASVRGGLSLALDYGVRLGLAVETPTYLRIEHTERDPFGATLAAQTIEMTTPWRVTAGFLAGSEAVLVTADVEVVDWSQARFLTGGDLALARENAFADAAFRTVINSRVGAEARLGHVALRVGAAFQPDPRFDGPVPQAVWQQYAVGVGMRVHPQARLDVAFVHTLDEDAFSPFEAERGVRNAVQVGVDVRF